MLDDVLGYLRCPHCGGALARTGGSLRCVSGHCFDVARQGYVSLASAGGTKSAGDTAAMVLARAEFLGAGHFEGVAAMVADAVAEVSSQASGCLVEVGAGTGYYLAAALDRLPRHVGIALDISRSALRVAARAHQRIGAVACDAWRPLPVTDAAADVVLNVFAPRDGAQLRRITHPGGALLVVTPAPEHLGELIAPLHLLSVDERKAERLAGKLAPFFDVVDEAEHRTELALDHAAITALVAMGPSSRHAGPAELGAWIGRLPEPLPVSIAVRLAVLRPVSPGRRR